MFLDSLSASFLKAPPIIILGMGARLSGPFTNSWAFSRRQVRGISVNFGFITLWLYVLRWSYMFACFTSTSWTNEAFEHNPNSQWKKHKTVGWKWMLPQFGLSHYLYHWAITYMWNFTFASIPFISFHLFQFHLFQCVWPRIAGF